MRLAPPALLALLFAFSRAGAQPEVTPPQPAPSPEAVREAVRKGVDFLLKAQNRNGSWGSGDSPRTTEVLADVPGSHQAFRVATTALCVLSLHRSPVREDACGKAVERGLRFLLENYRVRRPNGMELYNVWAFGYSLRAFGELLGEAEEPELRRQILEACKNIIHKLEIYQSADGGWGYYDFVAGTYHPSDASMTFTTATILVSLHGLEGKEIQVPQKMVERAVKSLRRSRLDSGAYLYCPDRQYLPQAGYNKVKGSLGRAQSCNLALRYYDANVTDDDLRKGIENFFRYHRFMDLGIRRPMPHESWYSTSGYYFYYGHYYAGLVIDLLPEGERAPWRSRLEDVFLRRQEPDGSWWDYPLYSYHKQYGTAYALLALIR